MKKNFFTISIFLLILVFCSVEGQQLNKLCGETSSKKAKKYYEEALDANKARKPYKDIKELLESAIEEDTEFVAAYKFLGDVAWRKEDFKTAHQSYEQTLSLCPDAGADVYYKLGDFYYSINKFKEAAKYLKGYKEMGDEDSVRNSNADKWLTRSQLKSNPVPFNPVKLKNICTPDPEYLPVISADNELCFFTRRFDEQSRGSITGHNVEKFMIAKLQHDGTFDSGEPMPYPFNKNVSGNEGAVSISLDNTHLYFAENDKGNFDLYESSLGEKGWSDFKLLGPHVNHPKQWDSQPCIAPDGNTLYFSSYRDSINQTSDIYFCTKNMDGTWSDPKPLTAVNTKGSEKSPFMHPDNHTFYFASNGYSGMGGYDIYMCKRDDKNNWSKPVNIGYPINSEGDEVGFIVSTNGKQGYFASNEIPASGSYDIYSFDIPGNIRPDSVLLLKGDIKDENEDIPVDARIELKNIQTKEITKIDYDTITGKYAKVVLFNNDYIVTVKQKGYAFTSQFYSRQDTIFSVPRPVDFQLKKIEVNRAYELKNILFPTNSAELNNDSKYTIEDFAAFLRDNPSVIVEIRGHTDNEGNSAENMRLSNDRAKAVYEFLLTLKLDANRLSYRGYGQTKPIADNSTDEGKAQNRRTEFFILKK